LINKKHYISLFFIIALILGGCANSEQVDDHNNSLNNGEEKEIDSSNDAENLADQPFPVTIKQDDKEITIKEEPENILPLSLEVAEIVLELVDPSRIPATTKGIDDPYLSTHTDISDEIPNRISAATNIDPEEIISYDTDLLLITKMYGEQENAAKTLSQLDTPILSFDTMVTVDQFMESMTLIGEAIGEKEKAENIVAEMKTEIASIQEVIPENESPSVLILSEVGGDMGPFMMGPTNISYDLTQLAGATPAVDSIELDRSTPAAIEQILKMNPDYILLVDFFGQGEKGFEELMNDPGWNTLEAVKEERIEMIEAKYILNPNVENIEGLKMMTDWLYGLEDSR